MDAPRLNAAREALFDRTGREERLLFFLCSVALGIERSSYRFDASETNWSRFLELARRHRIVPLVCRGVDNALGVEVPQWMLNELRVACQERALWNLSRLCRHLSQIFRELTASRVNAVPLKGVFLAAACYDDIALREAGDIDFLVAYEDLNRVHRILHSLGYTRVAHDGRTAVSEAYNERLRHRYHTIFVSQNGVVVEPHFSLHSDPSLLPLNLRQIVAEEPKLKIGNVAFPRMPDSLQFLYLAIHGAGHEWERIQWIADIACMLTHSAPEDVRLWLSEATRLRLYNPAAHG
jgi:hypothetical protein